MFFGLCQSASACCIGKAVFPCPCWRQLYRTSSSVWWWLMSRVDYGIATLVGLSIYLQRRMQLVLNSPVRQIFNSRWTNHITNHQCSNLFSWVLSAWGNQKLDCFTFVLCSVQLSASILLWWPALCSWRSNESWTMIFNNHSAFWCQLIGSLQSAACYLCGWWNNFPGISYWPTLFPPRPFQIVTGLTYLKFPLLTLFYLLLFFILCVHSVDLETFCDNPLLNWLNYNILKCARFSHSWFYII